MAKNKDQTAPARAILKLPKTGGSYHRDPATGKLTPAGADKPTANEELKNDHPK